MNKRFPQTRTERFSNLKYRRVTDTYHGLNRREIRKIMNNIKSSGWGLVVSILLVLFVILTIVIMAHGG